MASKQKTTNHIVENPPPPHPQKMRQSEAFISFFFYFSIIFFILLRICDDIFLIYDALYEGVSEKVQTSANTKKRSRDFRLWQRQTFQHGNCPLPAALLLPHKGQPIDRGPLLLGNDIIILCRWMSAVLQTSPCNSDSTPYRLSLFFVFGWKL